MSIDNIQISTQAGSTLSLSDQNYVYIVMPSDSISDIAELSTIEKIESVTYFDGLGRPMQSIGIGAGALNQDIITHIDYDQYGRQDKDWLPYAEATGDVGSYRGGVSLATQSYYQSNYGDDFIGISQVEDINAYSQKGLEASPLNRVMQQAAPGKDWKFGNGHEIKLDYQSNDTLEVKLYTVSLATDFTPTLEGGTYYLPNRLYKTVTKDENWTSGTNHTTEEFKDKQGRVLLKRTYGDSDVNMDGIISGASEINVEHDTYYVYDDFGNLTYVIPPKIDATTSNLASVLGKLNELGYQYKYDERNRLTEKKIPGKGTEFMVYDKLDRPVLIQDTIQRLNKQWLFTKYDVFGRVAYTGIYTHNNIMDQETMQELFESENSSESDMYEQKGSSGTGYDQTYYSNINFPDGGIAGSGLEVLTVNYYDNYYFDKNGMTLPNSVYEVTVINYDGNSNMKTKGLPTGAKVKVLETSNWITTVTGYNKQAMPIYGYTYNSYLETTDIVESKLDFVGKVLKTKATHTKGVKNIITEDFFTYDHVGRLLTQTQKIGSQDAELIVNNTYDNLGQLTSKRVGGEVDPSDVKLSTGLQDVKYTYNVRGWLKQINDPASIGNDLFSFKINYNTTELGRVASTFTPLYNGNISETIWKTANDATSNKTRGYAFDYDDLNRIRYADLGVKTTGAYNLNSAYDLGLNSYDKNGNIVDLVRVSQSNADDMDDLRYTYSGNQLLSVQENSTSTTYKTTGFKDGNTVGDDYDYDPNGNMTKDLNKDITNISYNHLNLPTQVTFVTGNISYIYDATGVKLQKKVVENSKSDIYTKYAGNYVYENDVLKHFFHAEGYTTPDGSGGFNYVYSYLDHLGNVRLNYSDLDDNGSITTSEILQENNYYPMGLKHKGYNTNIISEHKWKYNGKELQDELDLNWYDLGARNLDHALGRFMNVDPKAEQYNFQSPYAFANNNPVFFVDINGEGVDWLPKVNEDGSVSYIAEEGDSAETLQEQYNLKDGEAEAIIGNQKVEAGKTVLSGEKVQSVTDSEVLKLNLSSDLATSQRRFDQFLFARDYTTTFDGVNDSFKPSKFYSSYIGQSLEGIAYMDVGGESIKVRYSIPMNNGATNVFKDSGANRKFIMQTEPTIQNVRGTGKTRDFAVSDKLEFGLVNNNGIVNGRMFFNVSRSNSSKAKSRLSKKFPQVRNNRIKL